jgi:hypothetical protein
MVVTVTRAPASGADSTTPTVSPPDGLPATTPCSLIGAAAAVNPPNPRPGICTAAVIGTFEVSTSALADDASEPSENTVPAADGAS